MRKASRSPAKMAKESRRRLSARESISSSRLAKMLVAAAEALTRTRRSEMRSLSCVMSARMMGFQCSALTRGMLKKRASPKMSAMVTRHALTVPVCGQAPR